MDLLNHLVETRGFFTRAEAIGSGLSDASLAAGRRAHLWVRFCHGYYTSSALWGSLDPVGRHLLRADAAAHQMPGAVVFSHLTGALVHGLDTWGHDLGRVHVTRLDNGAGRRANGVVHHHGAVTKTEAMRVGHRVTLPPARCALETATLAGAEQGLAVLDSVRRLGLATDRQLMRQFASMEHWPDTLKLHVIVRMADARAKSVGESRTRWALRCGGIPAPVLQYEVRDADGVVIATCDMAWPDLGIIVEFDGLQKYQRFVAPGMSPGDVVFAEKRREDDIRAITGFLVIRVIWSDLDRPRLLLKRVHRAIAQQSARMAGRV